MPWVPWLGIDYEKMWPKFEKQQDARPSSPLGFSLHPPKIKIEPENDALEDHVPFFSWVICRFQPLIFQGVISFGKGDPCHRHDDHFFSEMEYFLSRE